MVKKYFKEKRLHSFAISLINIYVISFGNIFVLST